MRYDKCTLLVYFRYIIIIVVTATERALLGGWGNGLIRPLWILYSKEKETLRPEIFLLSGSCNLE